jgi:hypothetical protein
MPVYRWIIDHLLWDLTDSAREGFWGGLWAMRKIFLAIAGAILLTWVEWRLHHPPEIALVALIHFVFVFSAIGVFVYVRGWFRRRHE